MVKRTREELRADLATALALLLVILALAYGTGCGGECTRDRVLGVLEVQDTHYRVLLEGGEHATVCGLSAPGDCVYTCSERPQADCWWLCGKDER